MTQAAKKRWRRDEYRQKSTGVLTHVEIVPEDDTCEHISDEDCACIPVMTTDNAGVKMLSHNSFDGREFSEPKYRHNGH